MKPRSKWQVIAIASALLFTHGALAAEAAAPASEASIRELMEISQMQKLLDNTTAQFDGMMQSSMQQALEGQEFSPEQRRIMDDMRAELVRILSDSMRWEQLEPIFMDIYKRTFTQKEVDGMLDFYKTESGQALIAKMPLVMQNSVQSMQSHLSTVMPQIQQLQKETMEKLKATKSK